MKALTEAGNVSSSTETASTLPVTVAPSTAGPTNVANDGKLNCQVVGQSRINCSSEVYSDPATWRLSRDFLEQQIRVLRVQLDELKVIRKHLRAVRPSGGGGGGGKPANRQRSNSKSKSKNPSLFDWSSSSSPSGNNRTTLDEEEVYQPRRKQNRQRPKAPEIADEDQEEEEEEEDVVDEEEEEEEPSGAGPVETIEVTIYDNRKIK